MLSSLPAPIISSFFLTETRFSFLSFSAAGPAVLNMEPEFSTKQLKGKRPDTNYTACLICQKTDSNAGPLQKLTVKGYPALLYAVANRNDDVSFRLENELDPQCAFLERNPVCHTKCRNKYTNRKTVDQRKSKFTKQEGTSSEAGPSAEPDSSAKKNTVFSASAFQIQGRMLHLWKSSQYQGG